MKILHICLSCFYIDEAAYQENELVQAHVRAGHEVRVIASTETFDSNGKLTYVEPNSYEGADGAIVERVSYWRWLPHSIGKKLRIHRGIYRKIKDISPDRILFHGCAGNELRTVARYIRDFPSTKLFVDSHEDYNNSARTFVSRNVLHNLFYRYCLQVALPYVSKVLCVSTESVDFVHEVYKVPLDHLELFPLGGRPLTTDEVRNRRERKRKELGVCESDFLFLQSGKMTKRKKLDKSLRAFSKLRSANVKFAISGLISDEIDAGTIQMIESNPNVTFLGWQSTDELTSLLCAADLYVQPGTQSATMQHALCCSCPVVIADVAAHQLYLPSGAVLVGDERSLTMAMQSAIEKDREQKRREALEFSKRTLDYDILARRVTDYDR